MARGKNCPAKFLDVECIGTLTLNRTDVSPSHNALLYFVGDNLTRHNGTVDNLTYLVVGLTVYMTKQGPQSFSPDW